jgi:hypothetical protein
VVTLRKIFETTLSKKIGKMLNIIVTKLEHKNTIPPSFTPQTKKILNETRNISQIAISIFTYISIL